MRSIGTRLREATAYFYRESSHHSRHVTYTAWRAPLRAPKCSSCPVLGNGNAAGCSSVGISSERSLWGGSGLEKVRADD